MARGERGRGRDLDRDHGQADVGKSFLAIGACLEVYRGGWLLDAPCTRGRPLYVDAEMGPDMFADRLRLAATGRELDYLDAAGKDLAKPADLDALAGEIDARYHLVILDSLRALAPSCSENDSDSMAPVVTGIRNIARSTGAAVILLHHRGESEKFYRGSTAVRDQADAMLAFGRTRRGCGCAAARAGRCATPRSRRTCGSRSIRSRAV